MLGQRRLRVLVAGVIAVACAGAIDAALGSIWDQFAILLIVVLLSSAILLLSRSGRSELSVRPDLARWLQQRAAVEGESVDVLVDRSLATVRDHLSGEAVGAQNGRTHRSGSD